MFYTTWYICSAVRLTAKESRVLMQMAEAIENKEMPIVQRSAAVQGLIGIDPLVGAALLPFLVEKLMAESTRTEIDNDEDENFFQEYYNVLEAAVLQFLGKEESQETKNQVSQLHKADCNNVLEYIHTALSEFSKFSECHERFSPYQDADLYVKESFILALMVSVGELDPAAIKEFVSNESELRIMQLARQGELGQVCWNLSMRLDIILGEMPENVIKNFPDRWQERPDLVELVMPYLFPKKTEISETDADKIRLDELLQEAGSLSRFSFYWRKNKPERSESFWLWAEASEADCTKASIIMWQHIVWNLAFMINPQDTIHKIQGLWGAPNYKWFKKEEKVLKYEFLTYHQRLMIPYRVKLEREEAAGTYICSPWQRRTESFPDDSPGTEDKKEGKGERLFHAFKDFAKNESALKAFCAAGLLGRIMQYSRDNINVNYITMFLNLGDAFSCFGARNTFEIMEGRGDSKIRFLAWTAPIRLLGFYADKMIDEIGTGWKADNIPAEIMKKIKQRSPYFNEGKERGKNHQILLIYRWAGLFCAARWALLALRGQSVHFDKTVSSWLKDGEKSQAVQLVNYLYVIKGQKDEKTKIAYKLPRDSMELFYAMTEIEQVRQYELDEFEFSENESERIELSDLILKSNPSEFVWMYIGKLTPKRFGEEGYIIALTNRLRAQLESEESAAGSGWFDQWKEMIEDPRQCSWITDLAKLTLLRMLRIKFVRGDSRLKLTVDCILKYFAGERNDSPIYYYKTIADRLIEYDDEAKPYVISKWRGDFAVQLNKRCCETMGNLEMFNKWRALYYYFLLGIRGDFCNGQRTQARKQIEDHRHSYVMHNWNLRTFMRDLQEWDPIQDRFWAEEQGKLLTVGSQLDTSMRFDKRYTIADQFQKIPQEDNQWRVGIIAKISDTKIHFYTGDGADVVYETEVSAEMKSNGGTKYQLGDVYGIQIYEPGKVKRVKSLGALSTQKGYIEATRVHISASEISIYIQEQMAPYTINEAEELFLLWSGDTVDFLTSGMQDIYRAEVVYGEYDDEKYGWMPRERNFDELILDHYFIDKKQSNVITLTYLKSVDEDKLLFSVTAGENYVLQREFFTDEAWTGIRSRLFDGKERRRMRIRVRLMEEGDFPKLGLSEENAFDDVNIRWEELFNTQKPFQIRWGNKRWIFDCEMPEVRAVLQAEIADPQDSIKLIPGKRYNVEASNDGWTLREMRIPKIEVSVARTNFLNPRMSYDEFKRLVTLEAGMVFKLRSVLLLPQKNGYRTAYLDNGMKVSCADESISFQKDWAAEKFVKQRLCIVDNVKETRPEGEIPDTMRGVWPVCLEGIEHSVEGILAEFIASINTETENNENFKLKVFLDLDGRMQPVDVPLHAFRPMPVRVGERVDAVRTPNGWIFEVTKRDIVNVRALWKMKYHDEKDVSVIGEPLGLVMLSRNMSCAMTQDTSEPFLHAYENKMIHKAISKEQCGVTLGKGNVHFMQPRFSNSYSFPWAYKTSVVELKIGSHSFVGEARQNDFKDNRTGWNVHAEIHKVYAEDDCEYFDLRRVFTRMRSMKVEDSPDKERREEWIRRYKEWYFGEDRHAFAAFAGSYDSAVKVLLHDLRIPTDPGCEIDKAEFINTVDLDLDREPIVRGHERQYLRDDIRVRLKIVNGKWIASVKDVEAWQLNGKLIEYFGLKSGMYAKKTFYFAGRDEDGMMIFEWGFGNYFKARNEDIVDMHEGTFSYEFFFGDSIRGITFVLDADGEHGWKAQIRREDISHEVEGQVWEDSYENIVQLLKVTKNKQTGHIKIDKVSTRTRNISTSGAVAPGWKFHDEDNAFLSDDSQSRLQNEMGTKEEMTVFARINMETSGREKRDLFFEYISLNIREGQLGLLENKILCLQAYKIETTGASNSKNRISNDYKICFYLPDELPAKCENPRLVMSVNRRKFSLDESRLRLDALSDPDKYVGSNMLVSLGELSTVESSAAEDQNQMTQEDFVTHYWRGSVISAPKRSLESLKQWLRGVPPYLVTLACSEKRGRGNNHAGTARKIFAEIEPGIICDITKECKDSLIMDGTLARLSVEDDKLCTRIVLFGDIQYFSGRKRPVELLIMDDRVNHYRGSDEEEDTGEDDEETKGRDFTVASFPQILLKNKALMDRLIREGLPRIGVVHANKQMELEVEENECFEAGYLDIRQEDFSPVLNIRKPEEQSSIGRWNQITFKDGTVSEIVNNVNEGKWHYHDHSTGQYMENARSMIRYMLPDGEEFRDIVVFYAPGRRLRYKSHELETYGMSAREIVEHGLPRSNGWYPIAEGKNNNVWIEFFPGKVADVSSNYLMAGSTRCKLSGLCMGTFGAGDEILLVDDRMHTGGQHGALLMDFRFSGRDAVRNRKAILSIVEVLEDGLVLGGGVYRFNYPVVREETVKYYKKQVVILDSANELITDVKFESLQCGTVVYISLNDRNRMFISGMEDIQVSSAYEQYWINARWLYKVFDQKREAAFKLFENYIPMTITQIDNKNRKIWVAYQQKAVPEVKEGQSLAVNCIGMLPGQTGEGRVVLRSGNYLFLVDGIQILRGIDSFELRKICRVLAEHRIGFFMTMTSDGWRNGLSFDTHMENIDIELVCSVNEAKGYIVKSMKDLSLKYLPLHAACRVKTDAADKVWEALAQHPKRTARVMREDVVSLIDEYKSEEGFQKLRLINSEKNGETIGGNGGGYNEKVVPRVFWKEEAGCFYYFSELHPMGDIILLKSECVLTCGQETNPIPVELLEGNKDSVVVVRVGEKRRKIHLSKWFIENMRKTYYRNYDEYIDFYGDISTDKFLNAIPERFKRYGSYRRKVLGEKDGYLDMNLLKDDTKINERLVYLFFKNSKMSHDTAWFKRQCAFTLIKWLAGPGMFLSRGFSHEGSAAVDVDLIPAVAAICILDEIDKKEEFGELTVHLARMLGYACGLSVHEEQLIYGWIRQGHSGKGWNELQHLSLGGEKLQLEDNEKKTEQDKNFDGLLSPAQYKAVIENAESIFRLDTLNKYMRNTVYALLLSVADDRDYSEFFKQMQYESYCTVELAPIGRLLTPAYGRKSSFGHLPNDIKSLLIKVFNKYTDRNIELYTGTKIPLVEEERKYWGDEINRCITLCREMTQTKKSQQEDSYGGKRQVQREFKI